MQGKDSFYACSSSLNESQDDDKRTSALFHIRVVLKHTNIDTLFDLGSQFNLILEMLVKKLELTTRPHHKPYTLGWVSDKENLNTKQCRLRFSIASKMIDEVDLDLVPWDVCGIVLGSPYLYDRKAIFFQKENKYHIKKYGVEYIIKSHDIKDKSTHVSSSQAKIIISANKNLSLTIAISECLDKSNVFYSLDPLHKNGLFEMRHVFQWEGNHQKAFNTLNIDTTPIIALPDLLQSCDIEISVRIDVMSTNMLFRSPSVYIYYFEECVLSVYQECWMVCYL
jgi:hypothetical protein